MSAFRCAVCLLIASIVASLGCSRTTEAPSTRVPQARTVDEVLFLGETNRLDGSGGEILLNRVLSGDDPSTPGRDVDGEMGDPDGDGPIPSHVIQRLDVGDRLVGIGITHYVECASCPAGTGRRELGAAQDSAKLAARAFEVGSKVQLESGGYRYGFRALTPAEYSSTIAEASGGAVRLDPATIPEGTMVVSFEDPEHTYTVAKRADSPGGNWREATKGRRHWNVGQKKPGDFWISVFPTDDLGMMPLMGPEQPTRGTIRFGLSLLSVSGGTRLEVKPIECQGPDGTVLVDFCLTGSPVGTRGVDTPFPIGLDTEVRVLPVVAGERRSEVR